MTRLAIIIAYFCSICVIGCLLAYPIYLVSGANFERIVSRTILILAVLLFYPTCRLLKINSYASLGFNKDNLTATIAQSWLVGFIMLMPISIFFLSCAFRLWEPFPETLIEPLIILATAIISGLVIGLIEEALFRGLLQSQLSAAMNSVWAVLIVSVIYSSVHFLQAPDFDSSQAVLWNSGFIMLSSAFANFANINLFIDAWVALLLAGIFLSIVRLRTNNLFCCIGIHAGWVAHIKIIKSFTERDNFASCGKYASQYDNYIGELSAVWILLVLLSWAAIIYQRKVTR